jgi:hypothetical protein
MTDCKDCHFEVPPSCSVCPHCGRPSLFPNVIAASTTEESTELARRFDAAARDAESRGVLDGFNALLLHLEDTQSVLCRPLRRVEDLASSDRSVYPTYSKLIDAQIQVPEGEKWDILRGVAERAFFPYYHHEIRFAALTLDGRGPENYGDCSLVLRTDMIAHRASLLWQNCVLFAENIPMGQAHLLPKGFRAGWADRARLAATKLAARIDTSSTPADHGSWLLASGTDSSKDDFIEVHIFGPMTIRTVERVRLARPKKKDKRAAVRLAALSEDLKRMGVTLEYLP